MSFFTPRSNKSLKKRDLGQSVPNTEYQKELASELWMNEQMLRDIFQDCSDVVFRLVQENGRNPLLVLYISGLPDTQHLEDILSNQIFHSQQQDQIPATVIDQKIQRNGIPISQSKSITLISDVVKSVLKGEVVFLYDGKKQGLAVSTQMTETRAVEDPSLEPVIRGPREGFVERIGTNRSLLRRRLQSNRLKMESLVVGELSQTEIAIVYLKGTAKEELIQNVRERLNQIQIHAVLESGYLEEFITEAPYSPFPQVQCTERPDAVISSLLEGKVAILTDGTPIAMILPVTFWTGLQASEDYYERTIISTPIRWLRFFFTFVSLFLPSVYVSLVSYDHAALPTNLLISIASSQEQSPFPAIIETLLMETTFEALREAGVRLPKGVGSAVTIVGGIVIGQAAVQAGFISAPVVIIVATTGIASFIIPRYNFGLALRLLRFPLLLLAGFMGFLGLMVGMIAILIHLAALESFGQSYLSPVAPFSGAGIKDVFLRKGWTKNNFQSRRR